MDLEDDTTVFTTLKSLNSFLGRAEPQQRLSEFSGSSGLQGQYKRSMEVCVGECAKRPACILIIISNP